MNACSILRASTLAAAFASSGTAVAVTLSVRSNGTWTTNGSVWTFDQRVSHQTTIPARAPFDTATLTLDVDTLAGAVLFTNAAHTHTLGASYELGGWGGNHSTVSGNGTWTLTSGSGDYAGMTGSGALTVTAFLDGTGWIDSFRGDIQAVPEPASLAALALGGALLRRKSA